jgi:hypothetical protein
MTPKKWMPSLGELLDRLTICELKHLHNPAQRESIAKEIQDLLSDINLELPKSPYPALTAQFLRDLIILAQFNTHIWNQEDNARKGDKTNNDLYFTHQANGIRCRAKDRLTTKVKGRIDPKVNAIAAEIPDFEPSW